MGWQDYAVWAIGLCAAAVIVRRLRCLFSGRKRGGCASCGSTQCVLKQIRHKRKG